MWLGMSQASLLKVWVAQFLRVICGISYVVVTKDTGCVCFCAFLCCSALKSNVRACFWPTDQQTFLGTPFLRGHVYNICVTCEDLDLHTLNLSQYLHAFLIPFATTPEKFMYVQGFPIRKPPSRGKVHAALLGDQPCYSEATEGWSEKITRREVHGGNSKVWMTSIV